MTVSVTGGAGYIGSHMMDRLRARGRAVVVLDDLSSGHREAVPIDDMHGRVDSVLADETPDGTCICRSGQKVSPRSRRKEEHANGR